MHWKDAANISDSLMVLISKSVRHTSNLRAIITLAHLRVHKLSVVSIQRTWLHGAMSLMRHTRALLLVHQTTCRSQKCAFIRWNTSTLIII